MKILKIFEKPLLIAQTDAGNTFNTAIKNVSLQDER